MLQTTIARPVQLTGIGLHSGKDVQLKLQPAQVDTGIIFYRHTSHGVHSIAPSPRAVSATALATTLSDGEVRVSTVEHILAALTGMGIDNVQVHVMGGEIPIMDGSAAPAVELIRKAGTHVQHMMRKVARVTRPITVAGEGKSIRAWAHNGFYVDYTIDFPHPAIGKQHLALEINADTFPEIAMARTFGFLKEVEYLHTQGKALGGNLDNAVVLDESGVLNEGGLRCPDEFVRHKMLDFVGDMAMYGMPLRGAFEVHCSGHHLNNAFLRNLEEQASSYLEVVTEEEQAPKLHSRPKMPSLAVLSA